MPENKEMSEEEKESKRREDVRKIQLETLTSDSLKNMLIAYAGKNTESFGHEGKIATQTNYLEALSNPDKYLSRVLAAPYLESAVNSQRNGSDMYEEGISSTPSALFKNVSIVYSTALTKIKVNDILGLMGIKEVHEGNISSEEREMYMEDYVKKNEKIYGSLVGRYVNSIQKQGVAKAISLYDMQQTKNLEELLKEAPKSREENKLKVA